MTSITVSYTHLFLDMVENHKMIVENSGLLTVAALKHMDVQKKKIVSILSGGNMDVITMSSIVQHGLIQRDRVFTVSVLLTDKPGALARVSALLAKEQGNIIKLEHNQFISINRNAAVELRITLEAFGTEHKNQICLLYTSMVPCPVATARSSNGCTKVRPCSSASLYA